MTKGDAPDFDTWVMRVLGVFFFGGLVVVEIIQGFPITRTIFAFLESI